MRDFRWRPADGAVLGVLVGAILFAVVTSSEPAEPAALPRPSSEIVSTSTPTAPTPSTAEPDSPPAPDCCGSDAGSSATSTTTGPTPTTTASTAPAPAPPADPLPPAAPPPPDLSPPGQSRVERLLEDLQLADEPPRWGYDRSLFRHWTTGANGCSTREQVLIDESVSHAQVDPSGCRVMAGDWVSVYDGVTTDRPEDLDIDHVVALAEAWDSGAHSWDAARRQAFANDLELPGALIAVTSSVNRSKGDADPANWRPPNRAAWCSYATDWVMVKVRWGLTADEAEVHALREMLATCPNGDPQPSRR